MKRNITISETTTTKINELPVEIVERKGLGHPDSLCDGIAAEISREYSRWCQKNLGVLLHHNFDKVQLVAGESKVSFGEGAMIKPIRIQIAGRGTREYNGRAVPVDTLAIVTARNYLKKTVRNLDIDRHVVVDCFAGHGSSDLTNTVNRVKANDTSFGVAHWPQSVLEHLVYETSQYLNTNLLYLYPIGEDTKVMGCRRGVNISLTCAIPFIGPELKTAAHYLAVKKELTEKLTAFAKENVPAEITVSIEINHADNPANGDYYLTLTGTSAECGDDGQVGRGNRVTGFIAPFRPSSLEATCGKNAISHVGLIYNVLALTTAKRLVAEIPEVEEASVYLLSQIGSPVSEPLMANAVVRLKDKQLRGKVENKIHEVVDRSLAEVHKVTRDILDGKITLF
ncbi:MAG: methionine adenosyltransferase [Patescibacteria group bacterium]